jgi:hypothetical protein
MITVEFVNRAGSVLRNCGDFSVAASNLAQSGASGSEIAAACADARQ